SSRPRSLSYALLDPRLARARDRTTEAHDDDPDPGDTRSNVMANESYAHELWTGSGSTRASLDFQESGQVTCELHMSGMGTDERHYRLSGRYERTSDTCGRIFVQQITVQSSDGSPAGAQSPSPVEEGTGEVDLTALEVALIYEYVKVAHSPVFYHPDED